MAGKSYIPVSGKVFNREEVDNAIKAAKDCWWTEGRFSQEFENRFKSVSGCKYVSLVNSGSSANLLAVACLTAKAIGKEKLERGDEFISCAAGFPTTINPGIIYGLTCVLVDADLDTMNIDLDKLEKAITKKTKLIMVAHVLGIPIDIERLQRICKKHCLWLIEDCCDALGTKVNGKLVGTFGDLATYSFYPAHHITMGEGGAVVTNNKKLHTLIRQFRDWGRDCHCRTGKDNTCGRRFSQKWGELPYGYDHKYVYGQVGYNLKLTDFQPAIGLAQLKKLDRFHKIRMRNYKLLLRIFSKYEKYFKLYDFENIDEIAFFGFPALVKENKYFGRNDLTEYLEKSRIGTRNVFGGNLARHPAYLDNKSIRVMGDLSSADEIMNRAFWLGIYPGIKLEMISYVKKTLVKFMVSKVK